MRLDDSPVLFLRLLKVDLCASVGRIQLIPKMKCSYGRFNQPAYCIKVEDVEVVTYLSEWLAPELLAICSHTFAHMASLSAPDSSSPMK